MHKKLSMGDYFGNYGHVLYICEDSTISAIGDNRGFYLGDETKKNRTYPVKVKGLQNVIAVNAPSSMALKDDGTVWKWNYYLQSSYITFAYKLRKLNVDSVIAFTSGTGIYGGDDIFFLRKDGSVWAWGTSLVVDTQFFYTQKDTIVKLDIPKAKAIAAGPYCMAVLCEDSSVWTWGSEIVNGNHPASNALNILMPKPNKVESLSKIVQIAAGDAIITALKNDGTVWQFGADGSSNNWYYPHLINITDVKSINIGGMWVHYAIKNDGTIWRWRAGYDYNNNNPVQMNNVDNVTLITSAGCFGYDDNSPSSKRTDYTSYYVVKNDGSIWRWGDNKYGQLGNFTTFPIDSPEVMPKPCLAVDCDTITKNPNVLKLDTTVYPNTPIKLISSQSEADLYWWYPRKNIINGVHNQDAFVKISDSTEFSAVLMDTYGCMRKERFVLRKKCDPNIHISLDTVIIPGKTISLNAGEGKNYSWSPATNISCLNCRNNNVPVNEPIIYTATYTDTFNCRVKEQFAIKFHDCDTIIEYQDSLILDTLITPGDIVTFMASDAISYMWSPNNGLTCVSCKSPIARIYENTEFTALLTDKYKCQWKERFRVTNNCDSSTLLHPKRHFDAIAYPEENLPLSAPTGKSYLWIPSKGLSCFECKNPVATITDSIQYIIDLVDSFGCKSKYRVNIKIRNCDTIVSSEETVELDTIINFTTEIPLVSPKSYNGYKWSPAKNLSCSDCQNPLLIINESLDYTVETFDQWRCRLYSVFKVTMERKEVIIPNVFTPNNDGVNDYFSIIGLIPNSKLQIFDNNGMLVFTHDNYDGKWTGFDLRGKQVKEGTYWYFLKIPDSNTLSGWIYLKR